MSMYDPATISSSAAQADELIAAGCGDRSRFAHGRGDRAWRSDLLALRRQRCYDRRFELGCVDKLAIHLECRRRLNAALDRLLSSCFQRCHECFGCEVLLERRPIEPD